LGYHAAFIVSGCELFFNKVDVGNDILLVDQRRVFVVVIGEDISDLAGIIAYGSGRVILCKKKVCQLKNEPFGFWI
jgi:hypothetical protein